MDARTASYLAEILAQLVAVQAMRGVNETCAYGHQALTYNAHAFEDAIQRADMAREALDMGVDHQEGDLEGWLRMMESGGEAD